MSNRNDGTAAVVGTVVVAALAGLLAISHAIGASFSSVCSATLPIVFAAAIAFATWRFLEDFGLPILACFCAIAWPALWPVLDSIANGGQDSETYFRPLGDPFISSGWLIWGVEIILVALIALSFHVSHRRRRYW